jgi:enoyl-CoA hydratase/carnithine racemase
MPAGSLEGQSVTSYGGGIVLVHRHEAVATLTLNRPSRRNALNREMLVALAEALEELRPDVSVRVIAVVGAGASFCAGVDISDEGRHTFYRSPQQIERLYQENGQNVVRALQSLPQITIAAVNGPAVGWGACLATCCDFRVVADSAFFRIPEIGFGMYYDVGCLYGLLALVGPATAKRMTMIGDDIGALEAARVGLADRVTEAPQLLAVAHELALSLVRQDADSLRCAKRRIYAATVARKRHLAHIEVELTSAYYGANSDRFEGLAAYMQGRSPQFSRER